MSFCQKMAALLGAASISLAAPSVSQAAVVAYDSFNSYTPGTLQGGSGGTSWATNWAVEATLESNVNVVNGGLSYSGGAISIDGGSQALAITGDANNGALLTRSFANQTGSELWFSFLFRPNGDVQVGDFLQFWLGTNNSVTSSGSIGDVSQTTLFYGARAGTSSANNASSPTNQAADTTVFLVGRISTDGPGGATAANFDRMELWVNPVSFTLGTANAISNADTGFTSTTGIDWFGLRTVDLDTTDVRTIDELRVGTDFISVVPEPGISSLLMGSLVVWLAFWRRRSGGH